MWKFLCSIRASARLFFFRRVTSFIMLKIILLLRLYIVQAFFFFFFFFFLIRYQGQLVQSGLPRPDIIMRLGSPPHPITEVMLLPVFKIKLLLATLVSTLAQHSLQKEGNAEMPDFPVSVLSDTLLPPFLSLSLCLSS